MKLGGSISHAEGGSTKHLGVVLTRELVVLAILRGCKRFPPFKRRGGGAQKVYPVLRGEGDRKRFRTRKLPDFAAHTHPSP